MSLVRVGLFVSSALLLCSACQVPKAVDAAVNMESKLDEMNGKMGKMNDAIRLQKMGIALEQTMNEKTYLPSMAVPGATILTETATAEEIVKLVFVWLRNIDSLDNANYTPGYSGEQREALVKEMEEQGRELKKKKRSWYYGLLAISYTVPTTKLSEIIEAQITKRGQYEETAYQILAMRGQMAATSLSSYKPVNAAGVDRISDELEKIRDLTKYSFAAKIMVQVSVSDDESINGFNLDQGGVAVVKEAQEKIAKLTPGETPEWKKALARFQAVVDSMVAPK